MRTIKLKEEVTWRRYERKKKQKVKRKKKNKWKSSLYIQIFFRIYNFVSCLI